jgi:hypothetical protein
MQPPDMTTAHIADDESCLEDASIPPLRRAVIQFRLGQQRILEAALEEVDGLLEALQDLVIPEGSGEGGGGDHESDQGVDNGEDEQREDVENQEAGVITAQEVTRKKQRTV